MNLTFDVTPTPAGGLFAACQERPIVAEADTWLNLRIEVSAAIARSFGYVADYQIAFVVNSEVLRRLLGLPSEVSRRPQWAPQPPEIIP